MEAAAHTSGGYGGVPQSVGKDFAAADKRTEHMAKRKGTGMSHRAVAAEFGVSKSTVHRQLSKGTMKRGFTKGGKAK
jgi:transposase